MADPQLGHLVPDDERQRDAVHVAIAPVTCDKTLHVGEPIRLVEGSTTCVESCSSTEAQGIVDPFLLLSGIYEVQPGQRFWLCVRPGTVDGMRHVWSHPAFKVRVPEVKDV